MLVESWTQWQQEVVTVIRADFASVLDDIEAHEIDWDAWRPYFEGGCSPRTAVAKAFANDL